MNWFNYIGLTIIIIILIPNFFYMIKNKNSNVDLYKNKCIEFFEQVGRYSCFLLMIFNIPYAYYGLWFDNALLVYIVVNSVLVFLYVLIWILFWNKHLIFRAYALSIIPSIIFVFSSIILASYPLIAVSVMFAYCHIFISLKNAYITVKNK